MLLYIGLFSFLIFGMWEWLQSPFYVDVADDFNQIVWFRIHCTLADMLILFSIAGLVSLFKGTIAWMWHPESKDYVLVTVMGIFYTFVSEYVNVHVLQRWGYSGLMPVLPWLGTGIVPVIQWLILPSCILWLTKDHLKAIRQKR